MAGLSVTVMPVQFHRHSVVKTANIGSFTDSFIKLIIFKNDLFRHKKKLVQYKLDKTIS